ncbi:helix-turn-helix domain-containing protein [Streptomyces sp. NPDC046942]|uniref:helix-turn-helix domain-containing protein n=1 Tax=Streptomyces sp. NPDC046942 TaxID=3155137 RepID=UPI0033C2C606
MTAALTWSTHGSPQDHVPDAWSSTMSQLHLGWALSFSEPEPFGVSVRYRRLDQLTVGELRCGRIAGRQAATSEGPLVGVLVTLSGRLMCRYVGGSEVELGPGDLLVWDSELAHDFEAVGDHRELYLLLPRERLPQAIAGSASRAGGVVSVRPGSGLASIAAAQLQAITREFDHLSDKDLAIASQTFFDTLETALVPAPEQPVSSSAREALVIRTRRYIEDHLDDPDLCASSIAEAFDISVRTLHLAHAGTGATVGRWIRERRLKACYRDLSRAHGGTTVTDVAFRWGFSNMGHFSTAFKQAFGVTPSSVLLQGHHSGTAPGDS